MAEETGFHDRSKGYRTGMERRKKENARQTPEARCHRSKQCASLAELLNPGSLFTAKYANSVKENPTVEKKLSLALNAGSAVSAHSLDRGSASLQKSPNQRMRFNISGSSFRMLRAGPETASSGSG
jgi:hypothetical protein